VHPFEKRVAILEDNKLVELFAEKKTQEVVVGNIYKGIVKNVLPGMGAAFIDIGLNRTAFLHYRDLDANFIIGANKKIKLGGNSSNISKVLSAGQEIVVQVKKSPIEKKGARVTCKISIPGKFLVFMPHRKRVAISRKISSSKERDRLRKILHKVKDKNVGLIVRTDTENNTEEDFTLEYNGLAKTWKLIEKQIKYAKSPACIYDENNLSYTLIRDLFSTSIDRLVVDDKQVQQQIISNLKDAAPELIDRIELYKEESPLFDAYGIEKEIETIFHSKVHLLSGGNINIQQTEALVAIDINTGSFTGNKNYEQTIKKTNLEAAYEIARQIRLRDLSGIMVIDFIDMKDENNKEEVLSVLRNTLKRDRAKNRVYPFSPLGLVEISRKRTRASLLLTYSEQCPYCNGTGRLLARDSVAVRISRWLRRVRFFIKNTPVLLVVHPNVKKFLEKHPDFFTELDNKPKIKQDSSLPYDDFKVISLKNKEDLTVKYNS
ncbi:MAG: Rne/Rng family ribonuclease, partial [Candidatus Cloacimonadota bacterium]|nr:Rne/Rng family ribonuclease [Candidatus Cloacimonadota bacterium]